MVSALLVPIIFSKLVALAVDNERVTPSSLVLSPKLKVSSPAPPSSKVRLALPNVCLPPALVPNIGDTVSSPAPMLTLSPFTNLAELMVSSPSPKLMVNSPPITDELATPRDKFKLKVSAKPLPVILQLSLLLSIAEKPG